MKLGLRSDRRSSNFGSRNGAEISLLVMHYTGMLTASEAIARLCDTDAKVSAHYVVEEDGAIWNLVDEKDCAWHAGVSYWRGQRNVNACSIGIEIVNPGHEWGYRNFPQPQMEAVASLCQGIIARHRIEARNVVAHSDVAPQRKEDPGELFDWRWLAGRGVGLWPAELQETVGNADILALQGALAQYGYDVPQNGVYDRATQKTVTAFQRHFRPSAIAGVWDAECQAILHGLLSCI